MDTTDKSPANKNNSGRFQKGKSGNPSGRPKKVIQLAEKCREMTPEALNQILDVLKNGKPAEKLKAAELVLSYGYGKPSQKLEHAGVPNEPLVFSWTTNNSDEK